MDAPYRLCHSYCLGPNSHTHSREWAKSLIGQNIDTLHESALVPVIIQQSPFYHAGLAVHVDVPDGLS